VTQPDVIATQPLGDKATATLVGVAAIGLWSALALLTAASGTVPPFQLAAMTFAIGGGFGPRVKG